MLKLKIIGNPVQVANKLKTNRPLVCGQLISCGSEEMMKKFVQENPELVVLIDENELSNQSVKPKKNKMLKKTSRTKAK